MPESAKKSSVLLVFNFYFDENSDWRHVPTQWVPPALLPASLPSLGAAAKITGPAQTILKAAVRNCTWMAMSHLKAIVAAIGAPLPDTGSGKKGGFVKRDFAASIVNFLFGADEVADQERAKMVAALVAKTKKQINEEELLILQLMEKQSPDAAQSDTSVLRIKKLAQEKLRERLQKEAEKKKDKDSFKKEKKDKKHKPDHADTEPEKKDKKQKTDHADTEPKHDLPEPDEAPAVASGSRGPDTVVRGTPKPPATGLVRAAARAGCGD